MDAVAAMPLGRIHYAIGAYFIGVGTLVLLTIVSILPDGPSPLTVGYWLWSLGVGMIPFGIYYILTVRRRRSLLVESFGQ